MMEQGTIVSAEVLPKVAKEFAKAARQGGALAEALKTVRVQQGKFFTQSQKAQNTIFKSGYGEGLASFYETMITILKDSEPLLRTIGDLFRQVFKIAANSIKLLVTPLQSLGFIFDKLIPSFDATDKFANSTMPKLISFSLLLLTPWGRLLSMFIAVQATLEEIFALTNKGVVGQIERDLGYDIGIAEDKKIKDIIGGNTKDDKVQPKSSGSFLDNRIDAINRSFDLAKQSLDYWTSWQPVIDLVGGIAKDSGTKLPPVNITNNPVIDHSGNLHIENIVNQSLVNGQAQR